ncbi:adhesion G-protein coupled receptor G2-like [Eucyclogobius newberryi]|uniref:adhesion G-protein coupled receptor G2-like n=1 Tax=Eucyclogobius newberryi TaxID=166745 RepID=UPI003B5C100A
MSGPTTGKCIQALLEIRTDTTKWTKPDMTNCNPRMTIPQIENVTVTTENAAEVVETIQDLVNVQLSNSSRLSREDLNTVVGKLKEVVDLGSNVDLGGNLVTVLANILVSNTDVTTLSIEVLKLMSKMGDTMDFQGTAESITAPSLALSLCNVETEGFSGLTFGVSSVSTNLEPEVFLEQKFVGDQIQNIKASVSLPPEVQNFFSQDANNTRLQFQFFATDKLFQDRSLANSTTRNRTLISYIVSASLNESDVQNLKERVVVNLSHQKAAQPNDQLHCVFWDFHNNGGHGGWNEKGCETQSVSQYQTRCLCDHLTHFAVLLDVSRTPIGEVDSQILTVISYIGCGISAIFLGITLLTYLAFEKLRRDNPSKILINLSAALLGLCMLFLLNTWLSSFSNYGLCIATAATLHYFLLASFTWMGLEAMHMYLALVKVFNIYVPSYILKFCAVGWGVPLFIVSLVLAIDKDSYGGSLSIQKTAAVLQSSDSFCWVTRDEVLYVTVLGFILLILLANLAVFIVVLIQIKRMRINKSSANTSSLAKDLRAVASLTVLLGLTWSMGFFSFGPGRVVMMYLFSILNTLQGFFVFLFHCLMKDNVRKQWRMHLCCGRFRLSNYSDWTQTVTGGQPPKKRHLVNLDSDSSPTTSARKISDLSS